MMRRTLLTRLDRYQAWDQAAAALRALTRDLTACPVCGGVRLETGGIEHAAHCPVYLATELVLRQIKASQPVGEEDGMPVVYVAGRFRGSDPWVVHCNIHAAECGGRGVVDLGAMPLIPHAIGAHMQGTATDAFWLTGTLELMRRCDAVLVLPGWESSEGTKGEIAEAARCGIPVVLPENGQPNYEALRKLLSGEGKTETVAEHVALPDGSQPHPPTEKAAAKKATQVTKPPSERDGFSERCAKAEERAKELEAKISAREQEECEGISHGMLEAWLKSHGWVKRRDNADNKNRWSPANIAYPRIEMTSGEQVDGGARKLLYADLCEVSKRTGIKRMDLLAELRMDMRITGAEAAQDALKELLAIVDESQGVAGYHLNEEIAEWGTFPFGDTIEKARAALTGLTRSGSLSEAECLLREIRSEIVGLKVNKPTGNANDDLMRDIKYLLECHYELDALREQTKERSGRSLEEKVRTLLRQTEDRALPTPYEKAFADLAAILQIPPEMTWKTIAEEIEYVLARAKVVVQIEREADTDKKILEAERDALAHGLKKYRQMLDESEHSATSYVKQWESDVGQLLLPPEVSQQVAPLPDALPPSDGLVMGD